jgi:NitT/TauT family transport system substrate-binding protein
MSVTGLPGGGSSGGKSITLQEPLRAVFYAPFYAALSRGAYADQGVDINLFSAARPADAARGFFDGSVDVGWGGPMRVMETYHLRADCDLVCFAEVVTRDPFLLIGRAPNPDFTVAGLIGPRVGTVSEVPTPWLCLQEDLRRAGLDPARVDRVTDRTMAENADALRAGRLDAVQLFEPYATALLDEGAGHLWYAAADRGPTSYTTFYARRDTLRSRREELRRMVRALHRTQHWIAGASGAEIAAAIARYFPAETPERLARACERYKSLGIWGRDPVLPREGYERLRAGLESGGLVDRGAPFEQAVDNTLAREILAETPPTA